MLVYSGITPPPPPPLRILVNLLLIFAGNGATIESVRHCLYSLRRVLSPRYAVITITGDAVIKEPWTASCAMIVFPGGADLGYCRTLNGEGNRRISQFVERGGSFLGFCAGGYYGSKRCEFEVGNKKMEVIGTRELAFYPGICRGCAFPGFVYHSEAGTKAVELEVSKTALSRGPVPDVFRSYYNGGGVFVDAPAYQAKGVEILANYTADLNVDSGEGKAAVVYCKVGEGAAVLTSPHPEYVYLQSYTFIIINKQSDLPLSILTQIRSSKCPVSPMLLSSLRKTTIKEKTSSKRAWKSLVYR